MARPISSPLHIARHILATAEGWYLFVEVPLAAGVLRLVRDTRHREANGVVWQRAAMEIHLPAEDAAGSLGELAIAVPNVSRLPLAYVELDDEILGRTVTVWLQHESAFETFEPALSWTHRIVDFECDERVARFQCGHAAELVRVPGPLFDRRRFRQLLPSSGVRL